MEHVELTAGVNHHSDLLVSWNSISACLLRKSCVLLILHIATRETGVISLKQGFSLEFLVWLITEFKSRLRRKLETILLEFGRKTVEHVRFKYWQSEKRWKREIVYFELRGPSWLTCSSSWDNGEKYLSEKE